MRAAAFIATVVVLCVCALLSPLTYIAALLRARKTP
jgi:hypothetical protein